MVGCFQLDQSELFQKKRHIDINFRENTNRRNMEIIIKNYHNFPAAPHESLLVIIVFSGLLMRPSLWNCLNAPSHTSLHSPCLAAQLSSHSGLNGDMPGGLGWSSLCCPFKPLQLLVFVCVFLLGLFCVLLL